MKDDGSLFAAANHAVYGATVQRSDDGGKTWERSEGLGLPEDHELTLEKTWHVEPGPDGTLWLGGAPGVLFRSADRGESWEPVMSLIDHPTRERWNPGAGGMCTHSIQIDPTDPQTMYVGISAAGVFRSEDGGESWTPANKGTAADFMRGRPRSPRSASASTRCSLHPEQDGPPLAAEPLRRLPHRRQAARTGNGSRTTACRAASASRSRSTTESRTWRS